MSGTIIKVSGPLVVAEGLGDANVSDVVRVGPDRLIGEILNMTGDSASIQVYEETSGLGPGAEVESTGMPMSVELGPGMLENIYDGIQRPLPEIRELTGATISRGTDVPALNRTKKWTFVPVAHEGDELTGGDVIGTVQETSAILHKIMVPPTLSGRLISIKGGDFTVTETVAVLEDKKGEKHELTMMQKWPVRISRPYASKSMPTRPMNSGQRIIDTLFPIAKGGTAAVPGPFGSGKTVVQHQLAKWSDVDIVIYIGCGERGNEMTDVLMEFPELTDPRNGEPLMKRTVLIANTSDMPVAAREASIYTGITIAEYFRDMGYDVAVLADSTSRWAEALRELSGRMEEMPAEEGFPAYLPTRLASFYERAGRVISLEGQEGSVSVIGAVSPPGGDFSEPVTQHTKRFIRCFWALDRELANARHYPAIGWIDSYSEYADEVRDWWEVHNPLWGSLRQEALELLKNENRLQQIVRLIGPDALPDSERLVLRVAEMIKNGFLQQNAFDDIDKYCSTDKQIAILELMMNYYKRAAACIKAGATLSQVVALPVCDEIVRIKMVYKNEEMDKINEIRNHLDSQISEVERLYMSKAAGGR